MTFVQAWRADASPSASSIAVTINPSAGNTLVIYAGGETSVAGTPTCADGATAVTDRPINWADGAQFASMVVFYRQDVPGGSRTLTVNYSNNRTERSIRVEEHADLGAYIGAAGPNAQASPGTGANGLTSGNINIGAPSVPAWMTGISFNWGSGQPIPNAGNGNNTGSAWDYGGDYARFSDRRVTSAGTAALTFTATNNVLHYTAAIAFAEESPAEGPQISDVDPLRNGESATITGTFPVTIATVLIDGVAQTITSQDGTEVVITVVRGGLPYGVTVDLAVVDTNAQSDDVQVSLLPQAGWNFVDVDTPNPDPEVRLTALPDLAAGDQVAWDTVGGAVVVNDDLTWNADEGVNQFSCEAWDADDQTWGATAIQRIVSVITSMAAAELSDVAAIETRRIGLAELSATELPDTLAAAVARVANLTLAAMESSDVFAASVGRQIIVTMSALEAPDTAAVSTGVLITIGLAATEAQDAASASVQSLVTVSSSSVESPDIATAALSVLSSAALEAMEPSDQAAATTAVMVSAELAGAEASDRFYALVLSPASYVLMNATEGPDTAAAQFGVLLSASMAAGEAPDSMAAMLRMVVRASLSASEPPDVLAATIVEGKPVLVTMATTERLDGLYAQIVTPGAMLIAAAFLDEHGRFAKRFEDIHTIRLFYEGKSEDMTYEEFLSLSEEEQEEIRFSGSGAGYIDTLHKSNA